MLVGQHLGFHVPRLVEELLYEAFAAAEGGDGFADGRIVELGDVLHIAHDLQAAATATESRLDGNRQAVGLRELDYFVCGGNRPRGACHLRRPGLLGDLAG